VFDLAFDHLNQFNEVRNLSSSDFALAQQRQAQLAVDLWNDSRSAPYRWSYLVVHPVLESAQQALYDQVQIAAVEMQQKRAAMVNFTQSGLSAPRILDGIPYRQLALDNLGRFVNQASISPILVNQLREDLWDAVSLEAQRA